MSNQLSLNIDLENQLRDQFKGALLGAAIGDALGFMTEFLSSKEAVKNAIGVETVSQFFNWHRPTKYYTSGKPYNTINLPLPKGAYSDDTQLTLATARSIKSDGCFDPESFSKLELPFWLNYQIGGGSGTKAAAQDLLKVRTVWNNNFYKRGYSLYTKSGGNGAAMRILPIALVNVHNPEQRYRDIWKNTIATHGHPRGLIGAFLFSDAIVSLIEQPQDRAAWLKHLLELCSKEYPALVDTWKEEKEFSEWVKGWNQQAIEENYTFETAWESCCNETSHRLKLILEKYSRADIVSTLRDFGCFYKNTKGSGSGTVSAAILFLCHFFDFTEVNPEKFTDVLLPVVNTLGIDTDTIGYFVGGMLGTYSGSLSIPDTFIETLQNSAYIASLANRCFEIKNGTKKDIPDFNYPDIAEIRQSLKNKDFLNENITSGSKIVTPILGQGKVTQDIDLTPKWNQKHVHFLQIDLEMGQTIFLRFEKNLANGKPESRSQVKQKLPARSSRRNSVNRTNLISRKVFSSSDNNVMSKERVASVYLNSLKDRVKNAAFSPDVIAEVFQELKFEKKEKAFYDVFCFWLWAALPEVKIASPGNSVESPIMNNNDEQQVEEKPATEEDFIAQKTSVDALTQTASQSLDNDSKRAEE